MSISSERKFTAPLYCQTEAETWLEHLLLPDPSFRKNSVNSIYYDDPAFHAWSEKDNGDFLKSKLRLRWYAPKNYTEATHPVWLERKNKIGSGRTKQRHRLDLPTELLTSSALNTDDLVNLLDEPHREKLGLSMHLLPLIHLAYVRRRFVCPRTGVRVCLDVHIHPLRFNTNLLPGHQSTATCDTIVLEIKGEDTSSIPWLNPFYTMGFRERCFSKYQICLQNALRITPT